MYYFAVEVSRNCDQPLHAWQYCAHFIEAFARALDKEFFLQVDDQQRGMCRRKLVRSISTALNVNLDDLTPLVP
jgi:hypothetical protein